MRFVLLICVISLLSGCGGSEDALDRALALRNDLTAGNGCSFETAVTADYGEHIYNFSMDCETDPQGNLTFSVTAPATIAGISGKITNNGGAITFDDKVLAFQTIADGQITPVTAPWLLIKTLRSGYLKDCAATESGFEISIDDSYADDAFQLLVQTDGKVPVSAEIFWQGRRILTLRVENFAIL